MVCNRWSSNTDANFYFTGYYVPKSDGEFYQFCYVTHAGDIRGASTPFQFRSATPTEELLTVTEDDSNSDILVVTTKTGLLEVCPTSQETSLGEDVGLKQQSGFTESAIIF